MRLLFFNAIGAIGGAERSLLTMLESLRKLDPSIEIFLVVGTEGALIEAAEKLDVRVICLPLPQSINRFGDSGARSQFSKLKLLFKAGIALPKFLNYLKQMRRTIQRIQPDLIHSNSIKTHILLASLPRVQAPIVWHIHDFYQSRPLVAQILRWAQRSATGAIAVSNVVAKDAKRLLSHLPIQVIYNAVSVCSIRDRSTQNQCVRIGLVATFARWKGHDVFLKAASQVVAQFPDVPVQFLIVGAPIYQTQGSQFSLLELQAEVNRLKIDRYVRFLGFQSEMADVYQSLDIVVHASTQPEPFGLVIAEAMTFGKAVIVSNAGGAAELVTPNEDAIALPPGDVNALAQALIHLIQNPQKRQQLGQNARQTAIARFNSDRIGAALLQVYRDCGCVDRSLEKV
ncbi:glycosyltransferase family 4 protein [Leptolyngbya sp. FACHB-17]|uniref:glycosyltransferase family 4 protein n=1 Tax=unclassified Leptolyngbya TaxID=2650499 RepID=UPI00168142CC|nr:glycosyltransferase family 4 protein [Leptolyngbya sp. FACHB-17]MBD2081720.1 glycosyltransferase family 4 protein [Leptolyngbya sp. FACHB-17]